MNTRIIVKDIVSWAESPTCALAYMQCQLKVCQAYNLSLNLCKSHFFPPCFEFFGIVVCLDGNRPTTLKHQLLEVWPAPEFAHNVAKFIGFCQLYSRFIPNFEIRVAPLGGVTKQEYTNAVGPYWMPKVQGACKDLKGVILSNLCIQCFDHCKLIVMQMDFSSLGFGFFLLQPGNNKASAKATQDYQDGRGFSFMTKGSTAVLHPVCFGACCTQGNEVRLHSHLGEGFSGDYTINKCQQYIFSQGFIWVTVCYAISSFCPMRVAILQFCICICALCVGTWTLCIGGTHSSSMLTTGHVWALTSQPIVL
jgi:hypothetical protein